MNTIHTISISLQRATSVSHKSPVTCNYDFYRYNIQWPLIDLDLYLTLFSSILIPLVHSIWLLQFVWKAYILDLNMTEEIFAFRYSLANIGKEDEC